MPVLQPLAIMRGNPPTDTHEPNPQEMVDWMIAQEGQTNPVLYGARTAASAEAMVARMADGEVGFMAGLGYTKQSSIPLGASVTEDIGVANLNYAGMLSVAHLDATGDGDETLKFQAAIDALPAEGGTILLDDVDYTVNLSGLDAGTKKITWQGDRTTVNGVVAWGLPGYQYRDNLIRQDTAKRDDGIVLQIQRIVNSDDGHVNPKALRVFTQVNQNTNSTEWALSGELSTFHTDSGAGGHTAVSGVTDKRGTGGGVFGGHFQCKDWNIYAADTDVTSVVGAEMNCPVVGLDHPSLNGGIGVRFVLDIAAKTNTSAPDWDTASGNSGNGETGCGIVVRTGSGSNPGYFRNGIALVEGTLPMTTGIRVNTTGPNGIFLQGANTVAQIHSTGSPNIGAVFAGSYGAAAIRINSDEKLAFSDNSAVHMKYNSAGDEIEFWRGATRRAALDMSASAGGWTIDP